VPAQGLGSQARFDLRPALAAEVLLGNDRLTTLGALLGYFNKFFAALRAEFKTCCPVVIWAAFHRARILRSDPNFVILVQTG
jgi:hypothetical protein